MRKAVLIWVLLILGGAFSCDTQHRSPDSAPAESRNPPIQQPSGASPTLVRQDFPAVAVHQYLESIIGVSEDTLRQAFADATSPLPAGLATKDAQGIFTITKTTDGTKWRAGKFEFNKSVGDLMLATEGGSKPGGGTFNVVMGVLFCIRSKRLT